MSLSAIASAQQHIPTDWSVVAEIPAVNKQQKQPGLAGGICGIHQNVLIIAGGSNFPDSLPWQGGKKKYQDDVFILDLHSDNNFQWLNTGTDTLPQPVAYSACASTPDGIISVGGENEKGLIRSVYLISWDPVQGKTIINTLPDFPYAVTNAAAAYSGGIIYVAGGETAEGVAKGFYTLQLNALKKGWQKMPDLPAATSHTLLLAQGEKDKEKLYLIGGRRKDPTGISEMYKQVYSFDLHKGHWLQKRSLPYPLSAGTGVSVGTENIFLFGGDKGEIFHQVELLLSEISREQDAGKKQELILRKNEIQIHHPGFSQELLSYRIHSDKWKRAGKLDFTIPVTTAACILDNKIFIPGGEIRAGVRTTQVIEGKLK